MNFTKERKIVAEYMQRLYKKGLTTCSGGNVSMRDNLGNIFITASQSDKSETGIENVAISDSKGKILTPGIKPSMEFDMHFEIYNTRPDIFAVIHAHPVYTSIFAVSDKTIDSVITGEARYILGNIENIDYELMGTKKLAKLCSDALKSSNVAIMKNHGAICLGANLFEAYDRMEVLEFSAKIYYKTLLIGNCYSLNPNQIKEIDNLKNKNQ